MDVLARADLHHRVVRELSCGAPVPRQPRVHSAQRLAALMDKPADTRFEQAMQELRHALGNVKRYCADFSDAQASALLGALAKAGPNADGEEPA